MSPFFQTVARFLLESTVLVGMILELSSVSAEAE